MSDVVELSTNFKSALPPRKRAKTKEEKEQRRVERILRNRKAAHASREKKRKHVEFLESYVLDLEKQLQLVNKLNTSLLKNFYTSGNGEVDALVNKVNSLPDLRQMKFDHHLELDDEKSPSNLPKTPESFNSGSPKSSYEDFEESTSIQSQVPKLESRSSSLSDDSQFDFSNTSAYMNVDSTPDITNRFSLDIITGDSNLSNTIVVKEEPILQQLPSLDDPFKKEIDSVSTSLDEKIDLFGSQFNSFDNDFEFNELRNPAVITVMFDLARFIIVNA